MQMSGRHLLLCITLAILELPIEASHFRGGTISWKPTGNGNEVDKLDYFEIRQKDIFLILLFMCKF